jgi:hypothetical protein
VCPKEVAVPGCDLPGARSPACSATDHPFRDGRSLASALRYLPAVIDVCVRANTTATGPAEQTSLRRPTRPMLAAAAALESLVSTGK